MPIITREVSMLYIGVSNDPSLRRVNPTLIINIWKGERGKGSSVVCLVITFYSGALLFGKIGYKSIYHNIFWEHLFLIIMEKYSLFIYVFISSFISIHSTLVIQQKGHFLSMCKMLSSQFLWLSWSTILWVLNEDKSP